MVGPVVLGVGVGVRPVGTPGPAGGVVFPGLPGGVGGGVGSPGGGTGVEGGPGCCPHGLSYTTTSN
jgi:hypothetical protein